MSHIRNLSLILALPFAAVVSVSVPHRAMAQLEKTATVAFDPRDFSGVWWVETPGPEAIFARAKNKDTSKCESCHSSEHTAPEPALTAWAKERAVIAEDMFHVAQEKSGASIASTASTAATLPAAALPSAAARRAQCGPIGVPSQFWYTQLYPFEFVVTADRIFQFFEKQSEWRVIWMKRDHLEDMVPSYMGDSVGKWDGDTLVVDTVGFNGKSLIEPVGINHVVSDAFHLVERWRRTGIGTMSLDVTYYDPKVWGDKAWGGLRHEFLLQRNTELMETYCTAEDNARFDEFLKPLFLPPQK